MGTKAREVRVVMTLSNHNSQDDIDHEHLADELEQRISVIVNEPKYQTIHAWVV